MQATATTAPMPTEDRQRSDSQSGDVAMHDSLSSSSQRPAPPALPRDTTMNGEQKMQKEQQHASVAMEEVDSSPRRGRRATASSPKRKRDMPIPAPITIPAEPKADPVAVPTSAQQDAKDYRYPMILAEALVELGLWSGKLKASTTESERNTACVNLGNVLTRIAVYAMRLKTQPLLASAAIKTARVHCIAFDDPTRRLIKAVYQHNLLNSAPPNATDANKQAMLAFYTKAIRL
jgi:hypothetical protein